MTSPSDNEESIVILIVKDRVERLKYHHSCHYYHDISDGTLIHAHILFNSVKVQKSFRYYIGSSCGKAHQKRLKISKTNLVFFSFSPFRLSKCNWLSRFLFVQVKKLNRKAMCPIIIKTKD